MGTKNIILDREIGIIVKKEHYELSKIYYVEEDNACNLSVFLPHNHTCCIMHVSQLKYS